MNARKGLGHVPSKVKAKKPKSKAASPARKPAKAAKPKTPAASSPSKLIDARIRDLGDWRGKTLARMRALILEAAPEMSEEVKWVKPSNPWGVPVWSHDGIVCTGEAYKEAVKLTFARGASLPDPARLFNASLEGATRRAVDLREGDKVDAGAFEALVKDAVALNGARGKKA